jgi:aspartate aminotransferase
MLREYERRRNRVVEGLGRIAGVRVTPPEGAFYAFVDVSELFPKAGVKRSGEFARLLLERARVAAVPGSAFGDDHCMRLSFATSIERIEEGIARIARFSEEFG